MSEGNPWDHLSNNSINADDYTLIVWPPILKKINEEFPEPQNLHALDYGCGAGEFCAKLNGLGFIVDGIDTSVGMIAQANKNVPRAVGFYLCDSDSLSKSPHYKVITSIMTFPFIEKIENTLDSLVVALEKNGILLITDFNREWVSDCLKNNVVFSDFDSVDNPKKGLKTYAGIKIPVFIRDAGFYNDYFAKKGFEKIMEELPPFTEESIKKYPEYLILGYKKLN